MRLLAQNLKRMFFGLKNGFITLFGEIIAQDDDFLRDDLNRLARTLTFNQFTYNLK
jgi:hypothetical protein